jgi:lysophospholipase L1-like esterase
MSTILKCLGTFLFLIVTMPLFAESGPSFSLFDQRAKAGDRLSVVFLGGSLTWGAQATNPQKTSYRALIERRLKEAYPLGRFEFHDAAIGGTGSQLASFRLQRDVLAYDPDLVFLDFTINDDPYVEPSEHRLASYESIIRRLIESGSLVVQVILPAKQDTKSKAPTRPLDQKHKEIAEAYGVPSADAVKLARERVSAGETTPDALWDLPEDQTHPGDAGYALYADSVWEAFKMAISEGKVCRLSDHMLNAETYLTTNRFPLASTTALPKGWKIGKPHREAIAHDFVCSRWMDNLVVAQPEAEAFKLRVKGTNVLIFGEKTKKSGSFSVRINDNEPKTYRAKNDEGNMRLVNTIAEGLDPSVEHVIEITPQLAPGEELRIESLCVAGGPASVTVEK